MSSSLFFTKQFESFIFNFSSISILMFLILQQFSFCKALANFLNTSNASFLKAMIMSR